MLEVTQAASEQIAAYFEEREVAPIRVFLHEGGCCGPDLAMALDEAKDSDEVFDIGGFQYVVDKEFLETAKPIKVDFQETGFKLTAGITFSSGCNTCGSDGCCG